MNHAARVGLLRGIQSGVVLHPCSAWTGELAVALEEVWPTSAVRFRSWLEGRSGTCGPGQVLITRVSGRIFVASVLDGPCEKALAELTEFVRGRSLTVYGVGTRSEDVLVALKTAGVAIERLGVPANVRYTEEPLLDVRGVIAHVVEVDGRRGGGLAEQIWRRWPEVHAAHVDRSGQLGEVAVELAEDGIWIANLVALTFGVHGNVIQPLRYEALEEALVRLALWAQTHSLDVHMPRLGTGQGGATWSEIEPIVQRTLIAAGVPVVVHEVVKNTESPSWTVALAGGLAEGGEPKLSPVELPLTPRWLLSTREGVLAIGEASALHVVDGVQQRVEHPAPGRLVNGTMGGGRTLVWTEEEVFEWRSGWARTGLEMVGAKVAPLGEEGMLCLRSDGRSLIFDREWVDGPAAREGEGILLTSFEGRVVWLPGEGGRVQVFGNGRWWDSGELIGDPEGAVATRGGWVGRTLRQLGGLVVVQTGCTSGVVVPARRGEAWLLGDAVYGLSRLAERWVRLLELPFVVQMAAVEGSGSVLVAGEGGCARLEMSTCEPRVDGLGSVRERIEALLTELRERGLVEGTLNEGALEALCAESWSTSEILEGLNLCGLEPTDPAEIVAMFERLL